MCIFVIFLSFQDGVGEHWGDTGHVFRDRRHVSVSSHGHGGCLGVCQLPQLQWDWSGEEHVIRRPNEAVPASRCVVASFAVNPSYFRLYQGFMSISLAWWCLCHIYIPVSWLWLQIYITWYKPAEPPALLSHLPLPGFFPVCCVAVRNCLECRQRQRDRGCKSSLTSSKSQDSLYSTSTTSKVTQAHTKKSQNLFIPHKTLDIETRKRVALQYFCLPRLAGSRQTATGCRYQSAKSCCFQRCGKCVFVFIFTACVKKYIKIKCLLNVVLGYRMTVNRPSFWLWQLSTSSQFSWYPSIGIF